jgi:hypothetical protein
LGVVFLWTGCGELGGERGLWEGGFLRLWILQEFGIYFRGVAVRRSATAKAKCGAFPFEFAQVQRDREGQLQLQIQGFFAALRMTNKSKG